MNARLENIKNQIRNHELAQKIRHGTFDREYALSQCKDLDEFATCAKVFELYANAEKPIIFEDANFAFSHSFEYSLYPMVFNEEYDSLTNHGHPVTGSFMKNMSPDWDIFVQHGIKWHLDSLNRINIENISKKQLKFLNAAKSIFNSIYELQIRYQKYANEIGNYKLAHILKNVPYLKPASFHEALQSLLFMFNMLRLSQSNHIGFHRIDQYLYGFYKNDIKNGKISNDEALELVEEWFVMLNVDSDVYSAIQTGDSGMTVMLGGTDKDGHDMSNELTRLFLKASYNVNMLEPKINLRISKNTPNDILYLAAQLTKKGLGYPQYCNDEVVVPGLIKFGYDVDDAYDYTVAACWEFVVRNGMDTPNALYLDMPLAVEKCIEYALEHNESFEFILDSLKDEFKRQIQKQFNSRQIKKYVPNVLFSCLCGNCFEKLCDIFSNDSMHFYYGCHGIGSSTAVNQLAIIKDLIYDQNLIDAKELINAIHCNFDGYEEIRNMILQHNNRLCTNSDFCDMLLKTIFDKFADALDELQLNGHKIRPGTGSAQFYATLTQGKDAELKATCDGRKAGDYIASSLAPAPKTKALGILSTLQSFRHIDYNRICNGGPITIEMNPDFFANENSIDKFIQYIRAFASSGCQQLQVNILDKQKLLDAQVHPENYKNLVVRVWGWSGYFIELDKKFQDQIIDRIAYN